MKIVLALAIAVALFVSADKAIAHDEFGGSPYGGCPAWWEPHWAQAPGYTHWHYVDWYGWWPHWHEPTWYIYWWEYHHHWYDPGCGFSP